MRYTDSYDMDEQMKQIESRLKNEKGTEIWKIKKKNREKNKREYFTKRTSVLSVSSCWSLYFTSQNNQTFFKVFAGFWNILFLERFLIEFVNKIRSLIVKGLVGFLCSIKIRYRKQDILQFDVTDYFRVFISYKLNNFQVEVSMYEWRDETIYCTPIQIF